MVTGRRVAKTCVVVLMAASLVRCGGRDATHHDATSGASGSSGVGGCAGGSGGGPMDPVPSCVRALMVPCPYEGECLSALNDQQKVARMCIENGTVAVLDYSNDGVVCTPGDTITTNVYASDGSLCYKTVRTMGAGCESSSAVWFDRVGNEVATESQSYPSQNVTFVCTEGGDSSTCSSPCYTLHPSCTIGNCPNPL
jgi:hypothetical protein